MCAHILILLCLKLLLGSARKRSEPADKMTKSGIFTLFLHRLPRDLNVNLGLAPCLVT